MGNTNEKKLKQNDMRAIGQDGYRYDENQLKGIIRNFMEYGFTQEQIIQAWNKTNCKPDLMLSLLTKNQSMVFQQNEEEKQIQQAIELSIKNQNDEYLQDAERYLRSEDPIGLQNIGRTCYFNAFLQTLYHIRELRDPILKLELHENGEGVSEQRLKLNEMLKQFQLTFAAMLKSQKNFTDPTNLFETLKGLSGQVYIQGEENDFWEFQNSTLEFLEQAFMKDSEIDTVDLFKSYLRLGSHGQSTMIHSNSFMKKKDNLVQLTVQTMQTEPTTTASSNQLNSPNGINGTNTNTNTEVNNNNNNNKNLKESEMEEEFIIYEGARALSTFIENKPSIISSQNTTIITEESVQNQSNLQNNILNTNTIIKDIKEEPRSPSVDSQANSEKLLTLSKQESNKKKAKKIKNPITELFFGVGEEKLTISSKEGIATEVKSHDIPIGIFNLDVKMGDLYTALNSYFKYSVGDYQPEPIDNLSQSTIIKKQKKVDISLSIKTAPKILNFYINRIFYNKEINIAEKSNKKFTFDKEIYIDNYMKGKDQEFEVQKQQIQAIDSDLAILEAKLQKFENYHSQEGNSSSPILSAIDLVKQYLQTQIQNTERFIDIEEIIGDLQTESGNVDVGVIGQKQQLLQQIQSLDQYYQQIKTNKDGIEKKIKQLKEKKSILQNQNKTIKYELFSILIHQGYANTGHYYCFIYDDKKQCWYKFNDSIVTKVTEEEVFKQSYGEQDNNCNACCLFYKNSQTKVNPMKPVEISARLKAEVQKKDYAFLEKIDEIKIRRKFQEIENKFSDQHKECLNIPYLFLKNKNGSNIFAPFINSATFKLFLLNSKDDKLIAFGKRMLLKDAIEREDFSELESNLTKKENLYQGITLFYEHMKQTQNICGQILSDQEKKDLQQSEQFYIFILRYLDTLAGIMNDSQYFIGNFRTLGSLRKMLNNPKYSSYQGNALFNILKFCIKHLHEVFLLKSCFMIDKYFHQGQNAQAFSLLNCIVLTYLQFYHTEKNEGDKKAQQDNKNNLMKSTFESNELSSNLSQQIFNNLSQTLKNFGQQLDTDSKSKFEGQISVIQTPEKFPQTKQRLVNAFEEIPLDQEFSIHNNDITFRVYDQFEIFQKRSEVWISQVYHLVSKKAFIPQEDRLNKEEVLYFE